MTGPRRITVRGERPAPRRLFPARGKLLKLSDVPGGWRPSGSVDCCACFAVVWEASSGTWWAALHDFEASAQLALIASCRWADESSGRYGSGKGGRG